MLIPIYQHHATDPWRFILSPELDIPGWQRDGVVFRAWSAPSDETVPIYQFHASEPWRTIYSQASEAKGWVLDGSVFHVFNHQYPGTVPVYGFHNPDPWRGLYSTSKSTGPGWTYDGIAFYAFPADLELDFAFVGIDYEDTKPPSTQKVTLIDKKKWRNDSPAEISETIERSLTRTKSYHWELHANLKLGAEAEFAVGVPPIASAKTTFSAEIEFGAKHGWGGTEQESYAVKRTVTLATRSAIEVSAWIDWSDNYSTPFTAQYDFSAKSSDGPLDHAALQSLLELGSFTGKIESRDRDGVLRISMPGEFTGSFGVETHMNVTEVPL